MKCAACNREMKSARVSGLGPICEKKAARDTAPKSPVIRVELLSRSAARRSYLIFDEPRATVTVRSSGDDHRATCTCSDTFCPHIEAIKEMDRLVRNQHALTDKTQKTRHKALT
jgi:hypothetical protein